MENVFLVLALGIGISSCTSNWEYQVAKIKGEEYSSKFDMEKNEDIDSLVELSLVVKDSAYCPYSNFHVGAVILSRTGKIYTGINVENVSYGATICAERTAVTKAVSDGCTDFRMIVLSSDMSKTHITPCGICLQVISEFGDPDLLIVCTDSKGEYVKYKLSELLPSVNKTLVDSEGNSLKKP